MTPDEYQALALVTEFTPSFIKTQHGPEHDYMLSRMIHALLGLMSESGEIADALKKHLIYGKALDEINIVEEIGDLAWYQALALTAVKRHMSEAMELNIGKLKVRYGDKFTAAAALHRDLDAERKALEAK